MVIQEGYFYHIKDSFYQEVSDNTLMSNKEDTGSLLSDQGGLYLYGSSCLSSLSVKMSRKGDEHGSGNWPCLGT